MVEVTVWLIVAIIGVGCLNAYLMYLKSDKHSSEAKLWREHRDQWDSIAQLWNALGEKEDKHE